jgi:hypothetical protein
MTPAFNASFLESGCDIIPLGQQLDANTTDWQGDWIRMRDYNRATVLIAKYGSEQVDTLALQFLQAKDSAGTGAKALNVSRYWTKAGTLTAATLWTAGVLATPIDKLAFGSSAPTGATRIIADATTLPLIVAVDIQASDFDAEPADSAPFSWLSVSMDHTQVNNSVLFSGWVILGGGRFPQNPPLSAIS